jgi:hypothetical protein
MSGWLVLADDLPRVTSALDGGMIRSDHVEGFPIRVVCSTECSTPELDRAKQAYALIKARPYLRRLDRRHVLGMHAGSGPPTAPLDTCVGCTCAGALLDRLPTPPKPLSVEFTAALSHKCCTDALASGTLNHCRCITESKAILAARFGSLAVALSDLPNYTPDGRLACMERAGRPIVECSSRCACVSHSWMCGNRVVQVWYGSPWHNSDHWRLKTPTHIAAMIAGRRAMESTPLCGLSCDGVAAEATVSLIAACPFDRAHIL